MDGIKIEVTGNIARVIEKPQTITSGTVGMTAEFTFDSAWDGLGKKAVFRACKEMRTVPVFDEEVIVPWEVLKEPNVWLSVGVYGTNTDGSLVIPTIWANVCVIRAGASADGDPSADPTPPVWDQLNAEIEKLKDAIEGGGGGSPGGGAGKDGFSPIAKVTQTTSGAVITITDANGTTTATVKNGSDGKDGSDGTDGEDGRDGYTPVKYKDYFTEADKQEVVDDVLEQVPEHAETIKLVAEALPKVTAVDFSNFENGSFTETVDGEAVTHSVAFDSEGRPVLIDNIAITWDGEPGKEPVAYLYNGVRLPKLPEWDKAKYPNALIVQFWSDWWKLHIFNEHTILDSPPNSPDQDDDWIVLNGTGDTNNCEDYLISTYDEETGQWGTFESDNYGGYTDYLSNVKWSSVDLHAYDGSLYLAASAPVPVYE